MVDIKIMQPFIYGMAFVVLEVSEERVGHVGKYSSCEVEALTGTCCRACKLEVLNNNLFHLHQISKSIRSLHEFFHVFWYNLPT